MIDTDASGIGCLDGATIHGERVTAHALRAVAGLAALEVLFGRGAVCDALGIAVPEKTDEEILCAARSTIKIVGI